MKKTVLGRIAAAALAVAAAIGVGAVAPAAARAAEGTGETVHVHSLQYTIVDDADNPYLEETARNYGLGKTICIWCANGGCSLYSAEGGVAGSKVRDRICPIRTVWDGGELGFSYGLTYDESVSQDDRINYSWQIERNAELYSVDAYGQTDGGADLGASRKQTAAYYFYEKNAGAYYMDVRYSFPGLTVEGIKIPFEVAKRSVEDLKIDIENNDQLTGGTYAYFTGPDENGNKGLSGAGYSGQQITIHPNVTCSYWDSNWYHSTTYLVEGKDYDIVEGASATEVGTYTAKIVFKGDNCEEGEQEYKWHISGSTMSNRGIEVPKFNDTNRATYGDACVLTTDQVKKVPEGASVQYYTYGLVDGKNTRIDLDPGEPLIVKNAGWTKYGVRVTCKGYEPWVSSTEEIYVSRKTINVTVVNDSRKYGEENPVFETEWDRTAVLEGDDFDFTVSCPADASTTSKDNSYYRRFQAEITGVDAGNYSIAFTNQYLTIEPLPVTVKWGKTELEYSGSLQAPSVEIVDGLLEKDKGKVTARCWRGGTNVGSYTAAAGIYYDGGVHGGYTIAGGNSIEFTIVKATPSAPAQVEPVAETIYGKADGKLTGLTKDMEYRRESSWYWTKCTDSTVTGLSAGTYLVRYRESDNCSQSDATEAVVEPGRKFKITYPSDQVGYYVSTTTTDPVWHDSLTLRVNLLPGYSKTDSFAFVVNGEKLEPESDGSYKLTNLESDINVEVEGVADVTPPVIEGVEDGKIYCVEASFTVSDTAGGSLTVKDGEMTLLPEEGGAYRLGSGEHDVTVADEFGNATSVHVTVNAGHTPGSEWESDETGHWRTCQLCGEDFQKAEHNFEWVLTSYPVVGDGEQGLSGTMQQVCRDCDYRGEEAVIPGITAIGYKGTYDGEEHVGITLPDLPAGSEVMYGTEPVDEKPFSPNDAPKFKNAGDYMAYVKIKLPYFEGMYITGSVEVSIEKRELLAEWGASTLVWNGELQAPDAVAKNVVEGDDVAFSVDGRQRDVNEDGEVYTASIGGLAGKDAANYALPTTNRTCSFRIVRAGSDVPNVSATDETIRGKHDGSIEGVETGMEWRATDAEDWIPVSGSAVTGLAPGSYEVRRAATATHKASDPATVVVNAGRMLTVKLPAEQKGYTLTCEKTELSWLETVKLEVRLAAGYSTTGDFAVKVNGTQVDPELEGGFTLVGNADLDVSVEGVADVTPPTVEGIEDGTTYCGSASFTVADTAAGELSVLDDDKPFVPSENGAYSLGAGEHHIVVADAAGNKTQVNVVVNADHVAEDGWKSDGASHWRICKFCGEVIDRADHELAWVTDELPTVEKPGVRHQECGVCAWRGASEQVSYVSAAGYEGVYDGLQHGITLAELPEGALVEYSLDGKSFSSEAPQFKDVCDATVYYRATLPEVGVVEGSAQVKITPREVGAAWGETVFAWDGLEHAPSATATGILDGADVSLEVAGAQTDVNEDGVAYTATVSGLSGASAGNYCLPSEALTCGFFIKRADAAVPTVSGANESVKGKADGSLKGLSAGMEWRAAGADSWTAAQGDVDGLEPGTYEVRRSATETHNASPAAKVTIAVGRLLKVTLPATQTGYALTADKAEAAWREEVTLSFFLADGYSRTDGFALEVNGEAAELDADGRVVVVATEDLAVSVKGVADLDKPVISGIENGGVYCLSATFTVSDAADGALTVCDGEREMVPESDGTYRLEPGTHVVSVSDEAGNVTTKTVTVNATHTADAEGWCSDADGHWRVCACGEKFDRGGHDLVWVVDREATNKEAGEKHEECATCGYKGATVEIPLVAPKIVEGAGQTIEADAGSDLSVRSDADLDDFLGVKVDGAELDADSYEVASGSTVVTLKAAYLQTLAVGTHELEVVSKNGAAATTFTIKAKETVPEPTPEPEPDPDPDPAQKPGADPATDAKPSAGDDSKEADKKASESAPADGSKPAPAVPEAGDASAPALLAALAGGVALLAARRRRS